VIDYRTAGVLLIDRNGALLMQHRDEHAPISPNQWGLPGGRIEPGETPIVAAHRELLEETGLVVADLKPFWSGPRPAEPGLGHVITMHAFCGRTNAVDWDIVLGEGRWIGFIAPGLALGRNLSVSAALLVPMFLASNNYAQLCGQVPCPGRSARGLPTQGPLTG
jgi:8-oxo-dGTP diphosphatase